MENVNAEPVATVPKLSETTDETADHSLDPNDPPWSSATAFGVWIVSVLFILIAPLIFLMPYVASTGRSFADPNEMQTFLTSDKTAIILQIAAVFPAHLITLIIAWLVVTRVRKCPFRETLGWRTAGIRWWHYVLILVGFFVLSMIVGSYFPEQEDDMLRIVRSSTVAAVLIAIMAVFTAPVVEEVVYRGIMYSAFQRTFGAVAGVLLVAILFTSVHVPQYFQNPAKIALLFGLSLVLTLLRSATGNLLPAIILHTAFNTISAITLLADRYTGAPLPAETPAVIVSFIQFLK